MVNGHDQGPFTVIRDVPGPLDPAVTDVPVCAREQDSGTTS